MSILFAAGNSGAKHCQRLLGEDSRGEGHADDDSAQWVVLPIHSDGRTDLQITKGIQTGHRFVFRVTGHVAKVWTLRQILQCKNSFHRLKQQTVKWQS